MISEPDEGPGSISNPRASDHPGLVLVLYAYRAIAGLLVALPITALLGGPAANWPRAQAELFDPGAVMLVEAVRFARAGVAAVGWGAGAVAIVVTACGVLPLGGLLAGLSAKDPTPPSALIASAFRHALALALVAAIGALAQVLVAAIALVVGGKILGALSLVPPSEDIGFLVMVTVAFALAAAIGVLRDLVSVAVVRGDLGLHAAGVAALASARHAPARIAFAWAWRALVAVVAVGIAAAAAPPIARGAAVAVVLATLLHQAAIGWTSFLHASWLAAAMRAFDEVVEVRTTTPALPRTPAVEVES